jgi:hypothetical protein
MAEDNNHRNRHGHGKGGHRGDKSELPEATTKELIAIYRGDMGWPYVMSRDERHTECAVITAAETGDVEGLAKAMKEFKKILAQFPASREIFLTEAAIAAAANGQFEMLELLYEKYKVDIGKPAVDGFTPLMAAVIAGERSSVDYISCGLSLEQLNAVFMSKTGHKMTAADFAVIYGDAEIKKNEDGRNYIPGYIENRRRDAVYNVAETVHEMRDKALKDAQKIAKAAKNTGTSAGGSSGKGERLSATTI